MQYSHRDWYIKWGQVNFKRDFDLIKKRARVKKGTFHDLRRTAICDCFVQGMTEYDVMKLAGYSEFSTTYKYYLAVRDDLIDKARPTTARGLCKKLAHRLFLEQKRLTR